MILGRSVALTLTNSEFLACLGHILRISWQRKTRSCSPVEGQVIYPIFYKVLYMPVGWLGLGISEASTAAQALGVDKPPSEIECIFFIMG